MTRFLAVTNLIALLVMAPAGRTLYAADKVALLVTATDKNGNFVEILGPEDIRVFDNGLEQRILEVQPLREDPFSVAVLLDISGSSVQWIQKASQEATKFLKANVRKDKDRAATLVFNSKTSLKQGFTSDPKLLERSLKGLSPGGGSAIYDSVKLAAQHLSNENRRRIVVIVTDGVDNTSRFKLDEALAAIQGSKIVCYGLFVERSRALPPLRSAPPIHGVDELKRISNESGGMLFSAEPQAVGKAFEIISKAIRSQHSVSYDATASRDSGGRRELRVESADQNQRIQARLLFGDTAPE